MELNDAAKEAIRLYMPPKSRGNRIAALKHIRTACACDLRTAMRALDEAQSKEAKT